MNGQASIERLARLETIVSQHSAEIIKLREARHELPSLKQVQSSTLDIVEEHGRQIRACERFRNRVYGATAAIGAVSGIGATVVVKLLGGG